MAGDRPKKPITIFSVLALVVLLAGVIAVLYFKFVSVDSWINSGDKIQLDVATTVQLDAGQHVIFYESPQGVIEGAYMVSLLVEGPDGERVPTTQVDASEEQSYGPRPFLSFANVSGKPFWRLTAPVAGTYRVRAQTWPSLRGEVDDDRIVFNKNPQSFVEVNNRTTRLTIVLLAVTGGVVVLLYVAHGITLAQRNRAAAAGRPTTPLVPMDD